MKKNWSFVWVIALAISTMVMVTALVTSCANSSENSSIDFNPIISSKDFPEIDEGKSSDFEGQPVSFVRNRIVTTSDIEEQMRNAILKDKSSSMKNYIDIPRSNNENGGSSGGSQNDVAGFFNEAFRNFSGKIILEILKENAIISRLEHGKVVNFSDLDLSTLSSANEKLKDDSLWRDVIIKYNARMKKTIYWNRGRYVEMVFELNIPNYAAALGLGDADLMFYVRVATTGSERSGEESNIYVLYILSIKGQEVQTVQENIKVIADGVRELKAYTRNHTNMIDKNNDPSTTMVTIIADSNDSTILRHRELKPDARDLSYSWNALSPKHRWFDFDERSWGWSKVENEFYDLDQKKILLERELTQEQKDWLENSKTQLKDSGLLKTHSNGYKNQINSVRMIFAFS